MGDSAESGPAGPEARSDPPNSSIVTLGDQDDALEAVSYWRLMWWKFRRNRAGFLGMIVVVLLYLIVAPAEFFSPYQMNSRHRTYLAAPPQLPRLIGTNGEFSLRPFVYGMKSEIDPVTLSRTYEFDTSQVYYLGLFVRGEPYTLLGFDSDIHFFGVSEGEWFPLGTDREGRDLLSQTIYAGRVSLTVGFVGVMLSMVIGTVVGLASGFYGGRVDDVIQRGIEILLSFPRIPLWLLLSAAIPAEWNPIKVFFAITVILSLVGWGGLARVVRGMTLSLKNDEYILAARINGANTRWILFRHLFPGNFSYIIVASSLAIPAMILGETALSFLGLGIHRPMVSWGVLLRQTQDVTVLASQPWLVLPLLMVIVSVLAFNFVGDAVRDAADPLASR